MGELLYAGNCQTCHFKNKVSSAPSIKSIKQRYKKAFPIKEDFVSFMTKFVLNPKEQNSLMHDMIKKYELMPEMIFEKEVVDDISKYIYDNKF